MALLGDLGRSHQAIPINRGTTSSQPILNRAAHEFLSAILAPSLAPQFNVYMGSHRSENPNSYPSFLSRRGSSVTARVSNFVRGGHPVRYSYNRSSTWRRAFPKGFLPCWKSTARDFNQQRRNKTRPWRAYSLAAQPTVPSNILIVLILHSINLRLPRSS
jgi:hypothetical protein